MCLPALPASQALKQWGLCSATRSDVRLFVVGSRLSCARAVELRDLLSSLPQLSGVVSRRWLGLA